MSVDTIEVSPEMFDRLHEEFGDDMSSDAMLEYLLECFAFREEFDNDDYQIIKISKSRNTRC